MTQNLNPEIIFDKYKLGLLDRKSALSSLISFIENSNDENIREQSVTILDKVENDKDRKYKILENLLVSDLNEKVRLVAAKIIFRNYAAIGLNMLEWIIRNETSPDILILLTEFSERQDTTVLKSILSDELKKIIPSKIEIDRPFKRLTCDDLIEIFLNYKIVTYLEKKYHDFDHNPISYDIIDGVVYFLLINSLPLKSVSEITGLEKLTQLRELFLIQSEISEINGLEKLINLEFLSLRYNNISDIDGLEKLTKLKTLDLSHNQICNIDKLKDLKDLEFLDLYNNQIVDISSLKNLKNLKINLIYDMPQ